MESATEVPIVHVRVVLAKRLVEESLERSGRRGRGVLGVESLRGGQHEGTRSQCGFGGLGHWIVSGVAFNWVDCWMFIEWERTRRPMIELCGLPQSWQGPIASRSRRRINL